MERVTLKRVEMTEGGCRGVLLYKGHLLACTVELPWLDNRQNVSCIPEGVYPVIKHLSNSRGWVYWIQQVPERTNIQIHVANVPSELRGCVGVGRAFASMNLHGKDEDGVKESSMVLNIMRRSLPEEFELEVVNV